MMTRRIARRRKPDDSSIVRRATTDGEGTSPTPRRPRGQEQQQHNAAAGSERTTRRQSSAETGDSQENQERSPRGTRHRSRCEELYADPSRRAQGGPVVHQLAGQPRPTPRPSLSMPGGRNRRPADVRLDIAAKETDRGPGDRFKTRSRRRHPPATPACQRRRAHARRRSRPGPGRRRREAPPRGRGCREWSALGQIYFRVSAAHERSTSRRRHDHRRSRHAGRERLTPHRVTPLRLVKTASLLFGRSVPVGPYYHLRRAGRAVKNR